MTRKIGLFTICKNYLTDIQMKNCFLINNDNSSLNVKINCMITIPTPTVIVLKLSSYNTVSQYFTLIKNFNTKIKLLLECLSFINQNYNVIYVHFFFDRVGETNTSNISTQRTICEY